MIAEFDEIRSFAEGCFVVAANASQSIQFSFGELKARYSKSAGTLNESNSLIGNEPQFAVLDHAFGIAAYAIILSVDIRGSSKRAVEVGPKDTYLTMHTYLPTMAELVTRADGKIVGLRGDGLFASFALQEIKLGGIQPPLEAIQDGLKAATRCGKAMLEATESIINPELERNSVPGGLSIGVGISVGDIVVTRIGLRDANEVTAYGPPVNQACKLCSKTYGVSLSRGAWQTYPTGKSGRIKFTAMEGGIGHTAAFPDDYIMLKRAESRIKAG